MFNQDDPRKCTAAKLVKFRMAKPITKTTQNTLVLDPFAKQTLIPNNKNLVNSVTGIDCSWEKAEQAFTKNFVGLKRKLPPLFAGNPVNYSKLNKLTTVEAISGALYILGYAELAHKLLDKFKWGHTFYELNQNLLADYSGIKTEEDFQSILHDYGIQ